MINVEDGRGTYRKEMRKKNISIVKKWFDENPGKRGIDCANDPKITLSKDTIYSCIRELKASKG